MTPDFLVPSGGSTSPNKPLRLSNSSLTSPRRNLTPIKAGLHHTPALPRPCDNPGPQTHQVFSINLSFTSSTGSTTSNSITSHSQSGSQSSSHITTSQPQTTSIHNATKSYNPRVSEYRRKKKEKEAEEMLRLENQEEKDNESEKEKSDSDIVKMDGVPPPLKKSRSVGNLFQNITDPEQPKETNDTPQKVAISQEKLDYLISPRQGKTKSKRNRTSIKSLKKQLKKIERTTEKPEKNEKNEKTDKVKVPGLKLPSIVPEDNDYKLKPNKSNRSKIQQKSYTNADTCDSPKFFVPPNSPSSISSPSISQLPWNNTIPSHSFQSINLASGPSINLTFPHLLPENNSTPSSPRDTPLQSPRNYVISTQSTYSPRTTLSPRKHKSFHPFNMQPEKLEISSSFESDTEDLSGNAILLKNGIRLFNEDWKVGVAYFVGKGLMENEPQSIASFLITHNEHLSKLQIGELIAGKDNDDTQVLIHFTNLIDFKKEKFDVSLRKYLTKFWLPGEAQKIDRITRIFANKYFEDNPEVFPSADCVYVTTFSVIMLNTDMHSPVILEKDKMTKEGFIKNNSGTWNDTDPPRKFLEELYDSISECEIVLKKGEDPEKRGWNKSVVALPHYKVQTRTWFCLYGNELRWYRSLEQSSIMGRISLDYVTIREDGEGFSISSTIPVKIEILTYERGRESFIRTPKLEVVCESENSAKSWVAALRKNVTFLYEPQVDQLTKLIKQRGNTALVGSTKKK